LFCEKAFKFAVVRDPLDRFLSAYNYLRQGGRTRNDKKIYEKWISGKSIEHFLSCLVDMKVDDVPELFHFHTQNSFLSSEKNDSQILVDRVYKIEELDVLLRDFNIVSTLPSIVKKFSVCNKSEQQITGLSYESQNMVREVYAIDYKQFY